MSRLVALRLADLAERSEARQQRILEIRQESARLMERLQRIREESKEALDVGLKKLSASDGGAAETTAIEEVHALFRHDVLDQVDMLLREADAREREQWDEDDARILVYFQEAWLAARRKGYTLEDLQAVLRLLEP
jgi:tRNA A37 N6-isopentenylltransferase MiaA